LSNRIVGDIADTTQTSRNSMPEQLESRPTGVSDERAFGNGKLSVTPKVVILAGIIGVVAGYGAVIFSLLIELITACTVEPFIRHDGNWLWRVLMSGVPAIGILVVAWFTRRFAPEAQGHGVPEVIFAVARRNGRIRPRVALVKALASALCIGTGGSVGREGPIVQIGSSFGSLGGQILKLPPQYVKILVAAGAAAGISATFNAPIAGVVFSCEIILGNFAIASITPIVIASVLADVVQAQWRAQGFDPAFSQLHYVFPGGWDELPSYILLGLACGLTAVSFTKLVYWIEDAGQRWLPKWWTRALVFGLLVGIAGAAYPSSPPVLSVAAKHENEKPGKPLPPLFGVGYGVVDHALHLETQATAMPVANQTEINAQKHVRLDASTLLLEFWWLLPLALLKPLMTSLTLGAGGSGGIFAPSLFIGATTGASFGIICNLLIPAWSASPGVYAIVGMGAVVAGTTHGVLSAILIVYELTNDYRIILPIMVAAGLSSIVAEFIDPDSIYIKKLKRRGQSLTRGHELHCLEHIMVRDVMRENYPILRTTDGLTEIIRVARANSHIETLPVMDEHDQLSGIIHSEDLHRALDSDVAPSLVQADDIATKSPLSVDPDDNLLEAMRDFGLRDVETLPVITGQGSTRKLVGLLLRADVMRRYRQEILGQH
jgi:CIC family chloride channel protein